MPQDAHIESLTHTILHGLARANAVELHAPEPGPLVAGFVNPHISGAEALGG